MINRWNPAGIVIWTFCRSIKNENIARFIMCRQRYCIIWVTLLDKKKKLAYYYNDV